MPVKPKEQPITVTDIQLQLARKDFAYYCEFVHNRPLYRHQQEWAKEMMMPGAKTLIVCPPETYKTSTVRMFIEWYIGNHQDCAILYLMNTAAQAQKQVMSISSTIEQSPRYQAVFPHIRPDKARGWTKEQLFIQRSNASRADATIYGTGIDGPYQGSHVDLLIVDDPTDQQDVRSEATMAQQRERLRGVMIDRLQQGGSFIAIMTRWGEADLYRDFDEMGFTVIQQPLEGRYPWGRLLCPELFPDDRMQDIRQKKGSALFALTYMCDPGAASGSMVKREWWKYYDKAPELERSKRVHAWDLSIGRSKTADYCAFTHWGKATEGYYLLDAGHWQMTFEDRVRKMLTLFEQQRPAFVIIEDSTPSQDFIDYLKRHTRLPLMLSKPGGQDKVARLQGVLPLIEAGRVWLPSKVPWVGDYEDEMAAFPGGRNDDWVDSTQMALDFMERRIKGSKQHYEETENSRGSRKNYNASGGRW